MNVNLECIYCTVRKADELFSRYEQDNHKKLEFMKKVFRIVSQCEKEDTSPYINSEIMAELNEELGLGDVYFQIKKDYNDLILSKEQDILKNIYSSKDYVLSALKYAMIGNYIDFGAMSEVDKDKLNTLITNALNEDVDMEEYKKFTQDLSNAKNLVYLTDNSGEIVFDKVFIKILKQMYPKLIITVIVRGEPTHNDATIIDAEQVGLVNIVPVIGNGTSIPGTQLNKIDRGAKEIIDKGDLIISKGQGNFESLFGCGLNVYYAFLCKCDLFTRMFNIERFKGKFVNEYRIQDLVG